MKECEPRIVGDEIERDLLKSAEHHDILHYPGGWLSAHVRQLETVAVQVQGMDIIARVAKLEPVAAPLVQRVHRLHRLHGKGFSVQSPLIEAVKGGVMLDDAHLDRFIGRGGLCIGVAEAGIIPAVGLRLDPLRFAPLVPRIRQRCPSHGPGRRRRDPP